MAQGSLPPPRKSASDYWHSENPRGEQHHEYAVSLNNLAELYLVMGDLALAEQLVNQSREITKAALGENHPDYATSLNSLASLYGVLGDSARAETLIPRGLIEFDFGMSHERL